MRSNSAEKRARDFLDCHPVKQQGERRREAKGGLDAPKSVRRACLLLLPAPSCPRPSSSSSARVLRSLAHCSRSRCVSSGL